MENQENLEKLIEEVNETLKASEKTITKGSALQIDDHTENASKYLTDKAKAALSKIEKNLLVTKDGEVTGRAVFFSVVVANNNVDLGLQELSKVANDLAEKGWILSSLATMSSIKLAIMPGELPKSAVFFFPHIILDKAEEAEKLDFSIKEGEMGKTLGSTNLILPEGEFWAEARILHNYMDTSNPGHYDIDGRLFALVQEYLNVLPPGTKFLGANRTAIYDLSIPYELRFSNPLLSRVRNVELEYRREAAINGDKVIEGNVLTGIKYFDATGKQLYK
jgi:hypothetical protein